MERYRRQSVAALVSAIEAGRTDPAATVSESLAAMAEHDGEIRAFVHVDRDAASKATHRGPLAGIAVGVKDIFDTADMPTAYGSPLYAGHRPRADAAIVTCLKRAGAAIVGKTATTEFAWLTPTVTRNPNSLAHTPGGSSSGSAAAVAAGMIPAAIGTQTGGSVIRPAAFCGIAGYKPSYRLLPTVGLKHFAPALDTVGLMAASVADVACFAERLTGRPLAGFADATAAPRPRIGLYRTRLWDQASADMQDAVIEATERARAAGFDVVEIDEPDELAAAWAAHPTLQDFEASLALGYEIDTHADRLSPALAAHLEAARTITPEAYDEARRIAKRGRHACRALFERCDVLVTPSAPGAAPASLDTTGSAIFNRLWTLMGVPALNVPGLRDAAGLPLGIQVVGRFGADRAVLAAGAALEPLLSTS